jgi:hypothetical protein
MVGYTFSSDVPTGSHDFVRIGNVFDPSRQGAIYLSSDDSGAPMIDIIDGVSFKSDFNLAKTFKARLGNMTGIVDPVLGKLPGYGIYTQNATLTGDVSVAGTLTAGDANGFGNTFYAGRIRKNLLINSDLYGDQMQSEPI